MNNPHRIPRKFALSDGSPFERPKRDVEQLAKGQRIMILGRKGTFVGYYSRTSVTPIAILWLPDGTLEFEVTYWTQGGVQLSEWDDQDQMNDIEQWEYEMKENGND